MVCLQVFRFLHLDWNMEVEPYEDTGQYVYQPLGTNGKLS